VAEYLNTEHKASQSALTFIRLILAMKSSDK